MISFDRFAMEEGSPIYLQIIRYVKREVIAGRILHGDELPSRRVLSARLGVNPNTVQKAYRMLEEEGLIQSHSGAKSYMVLDGDKTSKITAELLEAEARNAVRTLKQMGLSRDEAIALFKRFWE
ncbi:MAG: GntR family transcriptional regulator [Oscillospiraceae bacterium]|nr:GntR family transcriptional regulator [Oscillospiraceae bacterium]